MYFSETFARWTVKSEKSTSVYTPELGYLVVVLNSICGDDCLRMNGKAGCCCCCVCKGKFTDGTGIDINCWPFAFVEKILNVCDE